MWVWRYEYHISEFGRVAMGRVFGGNACLMECVFTGQDPHFIVRHKLFKADGTIRDRVGKHLHQI